MTVATLSPGVSEVHRHGAPAGLVRKTSDVAALSARAQPRSHLPGAVLALRRHHPTGPVHLVVHLRVRGRVVLPGGASYKDFALPGQMLVFNQVTLGVGTGVGLSMDVNSGIVDRFRTLPMWRASVLVARSVTDLMTAILGAGIVAATGFAIGWSPTDGVGKALAGFALVLLFGYAISWGCACLGLVSKGVETAQALGLLVLFPLVFVSNALVPTQHMPTWLRDFTSWNPISAVTAAARELFGNPNPSSTIQAWPMQHPIDYTLIWSVGLLIVFVPLATFLYRRRTAG